MAFQQDELLRLAFALEAKSEHPLAKAIVEEGKSKESGYCLVQADKFYCTCWEMDSKEAVEGAQLSWWKCIVYLWTE